MDNFKDMNTLHFISPSTNLIEIYNLHRLFTEDLYYGTQTGNTTEKFFQDDSASEFLFNYNLIMVKALKSSKDCPPGNNISKI